MNRWWGDKGDSDKQAADRNSRAAARSVRDAQATISRLPQVVLSSDDETPFDDCETSFHLNLDGTNDPVDETPVASGSSANATAPVVAATMAEPFDRKDAENDAEAWKKEVKLKFQPHDVHTGLMQLRLK